MTPHYYAAPGIPEIMTITRKSTAIIGIVEEVTGVKREVMRTKTRKREVVDARRIATHLLKDKTKTSLRGISQLVFGDVTLTKVAPHSDIIHMLRKHDILYGSDAAYTALVKQAHHIYENRGLLGRKPKPVISTSTPGE